MYNNKKEMTWEELKRAEQKKIDAMQKMTIEQRLKLTINKMIKIANGGTGASKLYADMLLSMLPNSEHKVNISYWCYKADRDDFNAMLDLMKNSHTNAIWEYEKIVNPYREKLIEISKDK